MLEISEGGGGGWTPQEHNHVKRGIRPTEPSCVPHPRGAGTGHALSSSLLGQPARPPGETTEAQRDV